VAIDGSLIDAVLSMAWADYRGGNKKAKTHIGFDINRGIPKKIFLTDGKGSERPFVSQILKLGETGSLDRGYQSHKNFDLLHDDTYLLFRRQYCMVEIRNSAERTARFWVGVTR